MLYTTLPSLMENSYINFNFKKKNNRFYSKGCLFSYWLLSKWDSFMAGHHQEYNKYEVQDVTHSSAPTVVLVL